MIDENLMKFIEDYPKLVKSLISHNLFNFNLRKRLKSFSKILQSSDFSLEQSNDIFYRVLRRYRMFKNKLS